MTSLSSVCFFLIWESFKLFSFWKLLFKVSKDPNTVHNFGDYYSDCTLFVLLWACVQKWLITNMTSLNSVCFVLISESLKTLLILEVIVLNFQRGFQSRSSDYTIFAFLWHLFYISLSLKVVYWQWLYF